MPTRPPRRCLTCGTLVVGHNRCPTHTKGRYGNAEEQRMRRAVQTHRSQYGDVCPGYNRPAHPSSDLTADHSIPWSAVGPGFLTVLCRSCNARKGTR